MHGAWCVRVARCTRSLSRSLSLSTDIQVASCLHTSTHHPLHARTKYTTGMYSYDVHGTFDLYIHTHAS